MRVYERIRNSDKLGLQGETKRKTLSRITIKSFEGSADIIWAYHV